MFALSGISALACADNAVLFTADGADFRLDGKTQLVAGCNQLLGLFDVLLDRIVGAVKHDGAEARRDAGLSALIGAVVEVERNGNRDLELLEHTVDHADYGLVAAHIFACALGYAEDNGRIELLSRQENRLCPLEVVDVELSNRVVTGLCLCQHFFCVY